MKKLFLKIKEWFTDKNITEPQTKSLKTLKELDYLDTVWVLDNSNLFEGWVFDINKKHIIVTIPLQDSNFLDFRFSMTRPLSQTQLKQNNKILFLNKPCEQEI